MAKTSNNANIVAIGAATRFKPGASGNPNKFRPTIGERRLRRLMRNDLPAEVAEVMGSRLAQLEPLVVALLYARLKGIPLTPDQMAVSDLVSGFLWPKMAATPPPAPPAEPDASLLNLVNRVQQRTAAAAAAPDGSKQEGNI
jgi:hypothetical protein